MPDAGSIDYGAVTSGYENMHYSEDGYGGSIDAAATTTSGEVPADYKENRDKDSGEDNMVLGVDPDTGEHVAFETSDPELMAKADMEYEKVAEEAVMAGETLEEYLDETEEVSMVPPSTGDATVEESKALMEILPGDMDPMAAAINDQDANQAQEDLDMSLAMTAFASFGLLLFVMWYMLRSCKQKAGETDQEWDPSNP